MSDDNHSEILAEFTTVTGASEDRAKFYLESANWNIQVTTKCQTGWPQWTERVFFDKQIGKNCKSYLAVVCVRVSDMCDVKQKNNEVLTSQTDNWHFCPLLPNVLLLLLLLL